MLLITCLCHILNLLLKIQKVPYKIYILVFSTQLVLRNTYVGVVWWINCLNYYFYYFEILVSIIKLL